MMGLFRGIFRGPRLNCPERSDGQLWGEKSLGSLEKNPKKCPNYVVCPRQKNLSLSLQESEVHSYFYVQRDIKPQDKFILQLNILC
jgi:hypothetical protein